LNANNSSYQPPSLYDTTLYRLNITAGYNCGSLTTDTVEIIVNPLPNNVTIMGLQEVCANQSNVIYNIDTTHSGYSFYWDCNNGSFQGGQNTDQTVIHWDNIPGIDTLYLLQTINATGCNKTFPYAVEISSNIAPSFTNIIRKPNSNILICDDSTINIQYQWGYDIKADGTSKIISNANLRYVQLPHDFDTTLYRYWVDTYFEYASTLSCETKSYFNAPELPISIESNEGLDIISIYPNPSTSKFYIRSIDINKCVIQVMDLKGTLIGFDLDYGDRSVNLSHNTPNGVYLMIIRTQNTVLTKKIVLSR
jgi:hypothetical protein